MELSTSRPKQTAYRLSIIFILLIFFIIFTLRALPQWQPHVDLKNWTDTVHNAFPDTGVELGNDPTIASSNSSRADSSQSDISDSDTSDSDTSDSDVLVDLNTTVPVPIQYNQTGLGNGTAEHGPQFELVVSHYAADPHRVRRWLDQVREVPYIRALGMKVTIYCKNSNKVDMGELKRITQADSVRALPNIGREGQTMLHHITTNYNRPLKFTMFTQAEPEWGLHEDGSLMPEFRKKLYKDFRPNTGYLGLNSWNELCTCGNCGDRGHFPLQVAVYNMFEQEVCHGESWNGLFSMFIVSRQRIQSRPRKAYEWLNSMISAPAGNWIHAETQPDFIKHDYMPGGSKPDNPLFGHTVERSWTIVFNCSYPDRINSQGYGLVNEHDAHCWDWTLPHHGIYTQPAHWPGFEAIDAEWERDEAERRIAEERQRIVDQQRQWAEQKQTRYDDIMELYWQRMDEAEALKEQAEDLMRTGPQPGTQVVEQQDSLQELEDSDDAEDERQEEQIDDDVTGPHDPTEQPQAQQEDDEELNSLKDIMREKAKAAGVEFGNSEAPLTEVEEEDSETLLQAQHDAAGSQGMRSEDPPDRKPLAKEATNGVVTEMT